MNLENFHPATAAWFQRTFKHATEAQLRAWPAIQDACHTLIAAPTGSGKTLAAFMAAIDDLVHLGLDRGLADETHVLYVSPLKALSNDIHKNLEAPLAGVRAELAALGLPDVDIRAWVRSGDTPQSERTRMRRQPPHILVTTPESLYVLLTSESGRRMLRTVRSVIVDEIHALATNKRGAHLALSLERLNALAEAPLLRIGLSATQKPIETMARLLVGARDDACTVIDTGHVRERDLALEVPRSPLSAVMSHEVWAEIYDRLAELAAMHRTTLIFANTRRHTERAARQLGERLGEESVMAHHGSLSREHRLTAEQRLKHGDLKVLIATASLELGIDIGDVDLVCQLGSPRAIATFLQRAGRAGHTLEAVPKARLFPLSLDDLVECTALLDAVRREELDALAIPTGPLDVLAQQIVAEVANGEWQEAELYECLRRAWPYHTLAREQFNSVVRMLAQGFSTQRGRHGAYLHRDQVNGRLRGRRSARLTALTNGGAIPDQFDCDVVLAPEEVKIGTLHEEFAFDSLPGDIFQLGNTSYRILKIGQGKVYVADAHGQPPNIPFWFGEAPGRSDELSFAVSRLRQEVSEKLDECGGEAACDWLVGERAVPPAAATQLVDYLAIAKAALTVLPSQETIVFERFFDETGDQHLVIHSPFGSRLNRAWGLALRKRFCRRFNFELQAAALEDSIVLSLGSTHSFALEEVANYLKSASVREVLTQAVLDAPVFATRWRWSATLAFSIKRTRNGKRRPPQFQRSDSEDLLAVVFPDQLACAENLTGQREIPDHPLVEQTLYDCLQENMDIAGLEHLLRRLEQNEVTLVTCDLAAPSPLAHEILSARQYAFLDDAPAEERRTRAVQTQQLMDLDSAAALGDLDPDAIMRVRVEAWPDARDVDELHDALVVLGFMTSVEGRAGPLENSVAVDLRLSWERIFVKLCADRRATSMRLTNGKTLWVAAERLAELQTVLPDAVLDPVIAPLNDDGAAAKDPDEILRSLVQGRMEGLGPANVAELAQPLDVEAERIATALVALETQGAVMQGRFTAEAQSIEWCERRLLARIRRYTLKRLRAEIEPVTAAAYMRFLFSWHHLNDARREGVDALADTLDQLAGCSIPAQIWERDVLPARVADYKPAMLDQLCASGRITWARLFAPRFSSNGDGERARRRSGPVRVTPIVLIARRNFSWWRALSAPPDKNEIELSSPAGAIHTVLEQQGASFFDDLVEASGLLRTQVENALAELVAWGLVTADSFSGLRALVKPSSRRSHSRRRHRYRSHRALQTSVDAAGRWTLTRLAKAGENLEKGGVEHIAAVLLQRYGVVFRKVLTRESDLPPWRELLYAYRRMEASGEIRGGRFVTGFSGEQFALPEAVSALRAARKHDDAGELVALSAADPLNLVGIITPGERLPAMSNNRVLFRDGVPAALQTGRKVHFLNDMPSESEWTMRNHLLRRHGVRELAPPHSEALEIA